MPCNLNFNQCNLGPSYPRPIFDCRCRLMRLLSGSANEIVNPIVNPNWAFFNFIVPQTVAANGNIVFNMMSGSGADITTGVGGEILLASGMYQISYSVNGIIPANGTISVALYQDGVFVPASNSSANGSVGANATLSGNATISVPSGGSAITLKNTNTLTQVFNSGNLTIVRL